MRHRQQSNAKNKNDTIYEWIARGMLKHIEREAIR